MVIPRNTNRYCNIIFPLIYEAAIFNNKKENRYLAEAKNIVFLPINIFVYLHSEMLIPIKVTGVSRINRKKYRSSSSS